MVASRYDARCRKHHGSNEPIEAVASFRLDEPIQGHARRLFKGLNHTTPLTVTAAVEVRANDPGKTSAVLGWTAIGLGSAGLGAAGFFQYRAGVLHDDYRSTPQSDLEDLEDLRSAGKQAILFANIGAITGVLFSAAGTALVLRARSRRRAVSTFVGGVR